MTRASCSRAPPDTSVTPTRLTTQIVAGDCLDEASLDRALAGVQCAYYLVDSMAAGSHFADRDHHAADNFGRAAARAGVRRIVYLGELTDGTSTLSAHLRSRAETGEALRAGGLPVIEFRASVVIGTGSLSFQMIQALVERLPVMVCPRWVATLTQPIAIDDVLAYLVAALDLPDSGGRSLRDRRARSSVVRRHDAGLLVRDLSCPRTDLPRTAAPHRPTRERGHRLAIARIWAAVFMTTPSRGTR